MSDEILEFPDKDFASYIARERERLEEQRNFHMEAIAAYQKGLTNIDREFAAIEAYERAKTGKMPAAATVARQPRKQHRDLAERVVIALRQSDGLRRAHIIEAVGVKGDRSGEMSVSNALTRLQKAGHVSRREDGTWVSTEVDLQRVA